MDMDYNDLNCSLYVIIHHQLYLITKRVLYEVFSLYGYVEQVIRYKRSVAFHACIKFHSRQMQELFMNFKESNKVYI